LHWVEEVAYPNLDIVDMQRPDWLISHVLRGEVEVETCGIVETARAGNVMVHLPQIPFSERASGEGIHQWIAFDAKIWPHLDFFSRHPIPTVVELQSPSAYIRVFEQLLEEWQRSSSPARNLRVDARLYELLGLVVESWQTLGSPTRSGVLQTPHERLQPVLDYMTRNLQRKISRDELARLVHLHPGYLDRVFRTQYQTSPMEMLRAMRLRRAQQLLVETNDTLAVVARACGLVDAAHLSRVFRRCFNQTPGQYRASAKNTRNSYIRPM
jgi:AraC-like DNA-binding protein